MADVLTEQISNLRKKEWVNLQGLIDCSTSYLSSTGSSTNCLSISLLGDGSYNTVYRLVFSDGTHLAASVSNHDEEVFNAEGKLSEIETMKFVRYSGLYPDIPVPKVHAWDTTFNNSVSAPYVLMDVVEGENLYGLRDDSNCLLRGLDALPRAQQLSVVKALAKLKASLSRPVPFDKMGSIAPGGTGGGHCLGPLITLTQECFGGPFKSVDELWRSRLEKEMLSLVRGCTDPEEESEDESDDELSEKQISDEKPSEDHFPECRTSVESGDELSENQLSNEQPSEDQFPEFRTPVDPIHPNDTPHAFAEIFQLLVSLIPHFKIPQAYNQLVLHHPDLALRNIIFDKDSLSSGQAKIKGVLDWGGAHIVPLMLTAEYPHDLMSTVSEPFTRSKHPGEEWNSVPLDWTSAGDPTQYPEAFYGDHIPVDYASLVAARLHLLHGDTELARATLFADAPYYLKFHETVCGGPGTLIEHGDWIREMYWRLRCLTGKGQGDGGESLIVGPNVYRNFMSLPMVRDLGIFEDSSS